MMDPHVHTMQRWRAAAVLAGFAALLLAVWAGALAVSLTRQPGTVEPILLVQLLASSIGEAVAFACLGLLLLAAPIPALLRSTLLVLSLFLYALVVLGQSYAVWISNTVVSVLAVENAEHSRFTRSGLMYAVLAGGALLSVGAGLFATRHYIVLRGRRLAGVAVLGGAGFLVAVMMNAGTAIAGGDGRIQPGQSPVISLARIGAAYMPSAPSGTAAAMPTAGGVCGVDYHEGPFPFLREDIGVSGTPFAGDLSRKPNVVVLFIEGTSSRLLEVYGSQYSGLTPSMSRLARGAMVVNNYYNHTAATFRGLQGQLTSGYPLRGGAENGSGWAEGNAGEYARRSYSTLTDVLEEQGYDTVFLSPHPRKDALNHLLGMLGFDEIYTYERTRDELLESLQPTNRGSLTDHDLFNALIAYMERHRTRNDRPLFLGLYNIGTHAFLDVDPAGTPYGAGGNQSLNTLHNVDVQLGRFLDYFLASDYAEDTLLVLTSDHAHYPEPPFLEVATGKDYASFFVDRVPLIIRAPWLKLPARYDAMGRTTLDFAPSILHLLGTTEVRNAFLGHSIFDPGFQRPVELAAIGQSAYVIHDGKVYPAEEAPVAVQDEYEECWSVVQAYHESETRGQIFPADHNTSGSSAMDEGASNGTR